MENKDPTKRVLLWAVGRSLSTILTKCLSYIDGVQIIHEPYVAASQLGPQRTAGVSEGHPDNIPRVFGEYKHDQEALYENSFPMAVESDVCTFDWAQKVLEAPYPGRSLIFCKDIGFSIDGKYDMLPRGFRHTFLIRHPHKVFKSWKKAGADVLNVPPETYLLDTDNPPPLFPPKAAYGELYELVMYLKNRGDEPHPIVIDADDLQQNPASILRQYFHAVGIPWNDSVLTWPAGVDALDTWIAAKEDVTQAVKPGGFYGAGFQSTGFLPPSKIPPREHLSEDILQCVDYVWPYYTEMYEMRLRPQ